MKRLGTPARKHKVPRDFARDDGNYWRIPHRANRTKVASRALLRCILPWAGRGELKSRLTPSMFTVNVARVRACDEPNPSWWQGITHAILG